jgi:hypothetical protein
MKSTNRHPAFGNAAIVILFALAHFMVAVLSRLMHIHDDILLTILTIAMVVIIAIRNSTRVEMVAILTLVATILGFVIGSWLWQPFSRWTGIDYIGPAMATLVITLALGCAVNLLTINIKRFRA